MTEKELIGKIKNLNQIEADPKWANFCRDGLIQKYWGNETPTGQRIQKWTMSERLAWFGDILNPGQRIPVRVAAPIFVIAIVIFSGSIFFNMSQVEHPEVVVTNPQVSGNPDDNGGQSQNILPESESGSNSASNPSNIGQNTVKNVKKPKQPGSNPLANGLQVIIDTVRTVTTGGDKDQSFEDNLQKQTKDKIESLKGQVENLLRGSEQDIALAESVMPVLKEAEDLLGQGDLTGAFEKAVAVEKVLGR